MYKRILAGIPSKVVAGALGALLAGSVGAGALTGTMTLTSSEDDAPAVETPVVDDAPVVATDEEHADDDAAETEDEAAVDEADAAADVTEDAADAPPSSNPVAEAAHNHDFDEACGNHGQYVSQVAHGEDPACAGDVVADDSAALVVDTTTVEPKHAGRGGGGAGGKAGTSGGDGQSTKSKGGR